MPSRKRHPSRRPRQTKHPAPEATPHSGVRMASVVERLLCFTVSAGGCYAGWVKLSQAAHEGCFLHINPHLRSSYCIPSTDWSFWISVAGWGLILLLCGLFSLGLLLAPIVALLERQRPGSQ